jgi:hypothetical protein
VRDQPLSIRRDLYLEIVAIAVVEALLEAWAGLERVTVLVDGLRERIDELERQINLDSGNSSMPPSSDPPKSRAERRRAAREAYKRSMRSSGGQPGHEGKTRELVAPERADDRVEHLPDCCGCGHEFEGRSVPPGSPGRLRLAKNDTSRAPDTPLSPLNSHQHASPAVSAPIRVVNPPIDALHEVMRWIQAQSH